MACRKIYESRLPEYRKYVTISANVVKGVHGGIVNQFNLLKAKKYRSRAVTHSSYGSWIFFVPFMTL